MPMIGRSCVQSGRGDNTANGREQVVTPPFQTLQMACAARTPAIAIVLGSGLNEVSDPWPTLCAVPFADLPGMPKTTVAGHKGRLCLHKFAGRTVLVFQGRLHAYEGHPWSMVERPVRIAHKLGARRLLLTNASGGINPTLEPGSLMVIRDHIAAMWPEWWHSLVVAARAEAEGNVSAIAEHHILEFVNLDFETIPMSVIEMVPESVARENCIIPLSITGKVLKIVTAKPDDYDVLQKLQFILNKDIQPVLAEQGQIVAAINRHYGHLTSPYPPAFLSLLRRTAGDAGIELAEGVYACVTGPNYETPAEIRAFRALGADAIGMSTVHEAVTAAALGIEVAAVSCVANWAAGISKTPLSHAEVLAEVRAAAGKMARLLEAVIPRLDP
jgi:purine nucleoside phosphorylase